MAIRARKNPFFSEFNNIIYYGHNIVLDAREWIFSSHRIITEREKICVSINWVKKVLNPQDLSDIWYFSVLLDLWIWKFHACNVILYTLFLFFLPSISQMFTLLAFHVMSYTEMYKLRVRPHFRYFGVGEMKHDIGIECGRETKLHKSKLLMWHGKNKSCKKSISEINVSCSCQFINRTSSIRKSEINSWSMYHYATIFLLFLFRSTNTF